MRAASITGAAGSIRVSAVRLGWADAAATVRALGELPYAGAKRAKVSVARILGRLPRSEDVSDAASFVTDNELVVGGRGQSKQ
ncbi:MAG: hypothetical protein F4051_11140 [Boseongicola sp. SB0670_bin_30]|nr:hypothetical protein [Boseongicola sp. SB0670_bin_30]